MAAPIKVIASVKDAFKQVVAQRRTVLTYAWLPFLVYILWTLHPLAYDGMLKGLDSLVPGPARNVFHLSPYLHSVVSNILVALFLTRLYRYFLLNDRSGITKRNVILFAAISTCVSWAFLALGDLSDVMQLSYLKSQNAETFNYEGFNYIRLALLLMGAIAKILISAKIILMWPTIAVNEGAPKPALLTALAATRGNVVKIALASFLIYLPAALVEQLPGLLLMAVTPFMGLKILIILANILAMFFCMATEAVFATMLYRRFILKENG